MSNVVRMEGASPRKLKQCLLAASLQIDQIGRVAYFPGHVSRLSGNASSDPSEPTPTAKPKQSNICIKANWLAALVLNDDNNSRRSSRHVDALINPETCTILLGKKRGLEVK